MAKLKNTKFTIEGFKSQQSWIGKLLAPLNVLMNDLLFAFNGNITMENLSQEIKTLRVRVSSSSFPISFQQRFNRRVAGVTVLSCYSHTLDSMVSVSTLPIWKSINGQISVSTIFGLEANSDYTLKFHVIYED